MKKPVALTREQLEELVAKRKNILTTQSKYLSAKNLDDVIAKVTDFAREQGVEVNDVKFYNQSWSGMHLIVRRVETDEEKFKRIRRDENEKFRHKKWEYDNWKRQQAREAELAAQYVNTAVENNHITIQCECTCKCPNS